MKRNDDFDVRRNAIKHLSDDELHQRFWQLSQKLVDPMIELARQHTTPSIERSVLLRMGASSIEASTIVGYVIAHGIMGGGAGHSVVKVMRHYHFSLREAIEMCTDEAFFTRNFKQGGVLNETI